MTMVCAKGDAFLSFSPMLEKTSVGMVSRQSEPMRMALDRDLPVECLKKDAFSGINLLTGPLRWMLVTGFLEQSLRFQ